MTDEEDDYELDESMPSFRNAVSAAMDGVLHLGYGLHSKVVEQHTTFRALLAVGFWFCGNWAYNRITPPIFHAISSAISGFSLPVLRVPTFDAFGRILAENVWVVVYVAVLLLVLSLLQHRIHTHRLNRIESILTIMSGGHRTVTDGGDERQPKPKGGLLFALACAFIGGHFGPGGALAGFYLGWVHWKPLMDPEPSDIYVQPKSSD